MHLSWKFACFFFAWNSLHRLKGVGCKYLSLWTLVSSTCLRRLACCCSFVFSVHVFFVHLLCGSWSKSLYPITFWWQKMKYIPSHTLIYMIYGMARVIEEMKRAINFINSYCIPSQLLKHKRTRLKYSVKHPVWFLIVFLVKKKLKFSFSRG